MGRNKLIYKSMVKNFLLILLFSHSMSSSAQISNGKNRKDSTTFDFDSSFLEKTGKSAFEIFIDNYADSLNALRKSGKFPAFLEDAQFDYTHSGWSPSHHPIALRQMIISKVNNCQSIKMIIQNSNVKYKNRPVKENEIDVKYSNLSFYELAIRRYEEMNCFK